MSGYRRGRERAPQYIPRPNGRRHRKRNSTKHYQLSETYSNDDGYSSYSNLDDYESSGSYCNDSRPQKHHVERRKRQKNRKRRERNIEQRSRERSSDRDRRERMRRETNRQRERSRDRDRRDSSKENYSKTQHNQCLKCHHSESSMSEPNKADNKESDKKQTPNKADNKESDKKQTPNQADNQANTTNKHTEISTSVFNTNALDFKIQELSGLLRISRDKCNLLQTANDEKNRTIGELRQDRDYLRKQQQALLLANNALTTQIATFGQTPWTPLQLQRTQVTQNKSHPNTQVTEHGALNKPQSNKESERMDIDEDNVILEDGTDDEDNTDNNKDDEDYDPTDDIPRKSKQRKTQRKKQRKKTKKKSKDKHKKSKKSKKSKKKKHKKMSQIHQNIENRLSENYKREWSFQKKNISHLYTNNERKTDHFFTQLSLPILQRICIDTNIGIPKMRLVDKYGSKTQKSAVCHWLNLNWTGYVCIWNFISQHLPQEWKQKLSKDDKNTIEKNYVDFNGALFDVGFELSIDFKDGKHPSEIVQQNDQNAEKDDIVESEDSNEQKEDDIVESEDSNEQKEDTEMENNEQNDKNAEKDDIVEADASNEQKDDIVEAEASNEQKEDTDMKQQEEDPNAMSPPRNTPPPPPKQASNSDSSNTTQTQ